MSGQTDQSTAGSRAAEISNGVVRVISDYTGRGPTRARTYINEVLVSVLLQDTLTKGERSLVRDGKEELVLTARMAYQDTMREDLIAVVESVMDRKVVAFMSGNHMDPDMAVEVFVLEARRSDPSDDGA